MGKPNALSRDNRFKISDGDDNLDQIMLKPEHFRILAATRGHAQMVADNELL